MTATRVIAAMAGLVISSIAFGSGSVSGGAGQGHPTAGHLRLPFGFDSSAMPVEAGSILPGGELITHFEGAREGRWIGGTGSGRTIYTGTTAVEPTMGIDEKGNIFYQGTGTRSGLSPAPIVVLSRDGGRSWDDVTPQTHPFTQDPMLYVDTRTSRAFTADLTFPCTSVSHSDDVGKSWTTSQACGLVDHQNVFAGPPAMSPTVDYPNVVYVCAIDAGLGGVSTVTSCLKSLDGGLTWVRTGAPAYTGDPRQGEGNYRVPGFCEGGTGHGFVDSNGIVYLPRGWCSQPYLAISKDEGASWERVQVATNGMPRQENDLGEFEHEAAVAVDAKGNIYYLWTARDRLPYLAVSTDGGKSFSEPMLVGPPGLKEAWGPTIAVGDTGKVALAYIGSTTAPGGRSPDGLGPEYDYLVTWNGYITTSIDALSKKPRFFTASVNPPSDPIMREECGVIRCGVQFDFIDVVIDPDGRPWSSMVDGCPAPGDRCDVFPGLGFVGTVVGGPKLR